MSRLASGEVFTIDEKLSEVGKDRLAIIISKEGVVQLCDGGSESGVQSSFASDIMGKNLIAMTASEDANLFSDAMMRASHGVCSHNLTTKLSCHESRVEMDFFPSSNNFTVVLLSALSNHFVADVQHSERGSLCSNEVFALNHKLHNLNTEIRYLKDFRDSATLPMYSVGPNSTICWANKAMLDMMGYGDARHEYIGSNASLHHVNQSLYNTMLMNVLEGETLNDFTCNLRRRDGDVINVTYNSNAKFDSDGNFMYSRCIVQNMTEHNKLRIERDEMEKKKLESELNEKEAIAASKTKSDFLAVMSHEIRTPINGVLGAASLLSITVLNDEQRDYVNTITDSADILLSLIHNILDISKIEKGKFEMDRIPLRLVDLVRKCTDMMRNRASEKGLTVVTKISPALDDPNSWHKGDPTRLNQVLLNFLSNAVKFTHSGSVQCKLVKLSKDKLNPIVTVHEGYESGDSARLVMSNEEVVGDDVVRRGGGGSHIKGLLSNARPNPSFGANSCASGSSGHGYDIVRLEVTDTGCGIADCSKLFSPFVQANKSVHQKYGGTGLGLNISKKIVEMMHGRVGINSTEGVGTTVWAEIPLRRAPVPRKGPDFVPSSTSPLPTKIQHVLRTSLDSASPGGKVRRVSRPSYGEAAKLVKILIAEDNKVNQKVLKRMLETLGYTDISVSWNGQEAVDAVKDSWEKYLVNPTAGRFDIVLMDCLMPVMNGWSATEAIRNLEDEYLTRAEALSGESPTYLEAQPTIVLALTANATEEDKTRCSECGMDGFYVKPITRDGLNSMMLYWVSKLFADASSQPSSENNSPRDREGVWE